jgi:hypothetical protein
VLSPIPLARATLDVNIANRHVKRLQASLYAVVMKTTGARVRQLSVRQMFQWVEGIGYSVRPSCF